jgi:3-dehydroquinate synthase
MLAISEKIDVNLGERSYPIYIGNLDLLGDIIKGYDFGRKVGIITNPLVGGYYKDILEDILRNNGFNPLSIEIPDGEKYKSLKWVNYIYDRIISFKMDRESLLIALGGGVIGDVTGFVAATFLRGISYIQIPTTLLSQVDSSIGGKTGVNHKRGKNLIGAFYQPKFVLIDIDLLKTLDKREFLNGLAEIIKYGIILREDLFEYLENKMDLILNQDREALFNIIKVSCITKAEIVEMDERESGYRSILNFGHTLGHAIENITNYREFRHGEAVSIGMAFAAKLSYNMNLCKVEDKNRIVELIKGFGLPVTVPYFPIKRYLRAMEFDKKILKDYLKYILIERIGKAIFKRFSYGSYEMKILRDTLNESLN